MSEWLVPFAYDYLWRALWVSACIGLTCGLLSAFVTLRGWSLMGDALSHAVVPGVALAYWIGMPFSAGAFIAALLATAGMNALKLRTQLREDVVVGVVFTTFFALGLLLLSMKPAGVSLKSIIFGNVLAISDGDLVQVVVICGLGLLLLGLQFRNLALYCFDAGHARALGMNTAGLQALLLGLLAAVTVAAMQAVGASLVMATLVTPGATAHLWCDRFGRMAVLAGAIGAASGFVGAYVSYFFDGSTGGCIVVLQTIIFGASFILAPKHGYLARLRARARTRTLAASAP